MKKSLPLLIFSILMVQAAIGQYNNNSEPDFKKFGFRAGVNFSHLNFAKGVPPVPLETSWGAGINLGFLMLVHVTGDLYFQPEYAFSQMGSQVKSSDTGYKLNYFSLPVFLKYKLSEKFFIMAGPQFDLLINSKKTVSGNSIDITHDTEERSIGVTAGIEYELVESFSISARYMHGLNHIGLGQRSNIQEFKYEMMQLTACIKF